MSFVFSGWADASIISRHFEFNSLTPFGFIKLYSNILNRSFYHNIQFPHNFVSDFSNVTNVKRTFQNAQEAKRINQLYLNGHHYTHRGIPFRPEHGFFKIAPYIIKTTGPYGFTPCDLNSKTSSMIDHNFSHIYWLDHQLLPPPFIVRYLKEIGWIDKKIDFYIPSWLFDQRLKRWAGTDIRIMHSIINEDNFFILNCKWSPLKITSKLVLEQKHIKYCSIVVRMFKLEMLRSELERECKNLIYDSSYLDKNSKYRLIIKKIIEWQGSMIGTILYMNATKRYSDEELNHDFHNSKLGSFDEGFHFTMHLGELHDVSSIIKLLPFFSPVEKRSQKQRRIRGQQTDAGSIGDMRGTCYDNDKYICCITNVCNRGVLNPNRSRRVEMVILEPLKKLRGIIANEHDLQILSESKPSIYTSNFKQKALKIDVICNEINTLFDVLKNIKEQVTVNYNSELAIIEQPNLSQNEDFQYIKPLLIEKFSLILNFKKYQIMKFWRMEYDKRDFQDLFREIQNILSHLNNDRIDFDISKSLKTFLGPSSNMITSIITKMDKTIRNCIVRNQFNVDDSLKLKKYASKILIFDDDILKKYLSKDFIYELLKTLKSELQEMKELKWSLFSQKNDTKQINLSSCLRRFLICNEENFDEIQNKKILDIFEDNDEYNEDNVDDDDSMSEYSSTIHIKKGRSKQEAVYIPSWSGFAQKKVYNGEVKVANRNGGHNAHRFLDFIMRIFGVCLLGAYPNDNYQPSFDMLLEVYRFIQFDYPSIDDFCLWIETILPFDIKILEKKKNQMSKLLNTKTNGKFKKLSIPLESEELHEIYKHINSKEGSQCRRLFIVYLLRQHHIFFVNEIPSLSEKLQRIYQWDKITDNVYKTLDINKNLIDEIICDMRHHERDCVVKKKSQNDCNHCKRWAYVKSHFHPKLVELYKKWPILFAIDIVCQTQKEKDIIVQPNTTKKVVKTKIFKNQNNNSDEFIDRNVYFSNKLNFPINNYQSTQPFNGDMHIELLSYCPRPMMRSFEQNVIEQLSDIDSIFISPFSVFGEYTTEKERLNAEYNKRIMDLAKRAVKEYEYCQNMYMKNNHEHVEKVIEKVITKFPPNSKIGLEWMISFFGISLKSIRKIEKSRILFEKEQSRTLAKKVFLKLLSKQPKDFFILRTFFNMIVHYNRIVCATTTHSIFKNTFNSVLKKTKDYDSLIIQKDQPIPDHFFKFWVCLPHGTMQVALVGSELGTEGEKNTKSYGNSGITINPNDSKVYCTISGRRMEKKLPDDISWICINKPNFRVNMLGKILQLYDIVYIMCEYCGNVMHFYWERVCAGGPDLWCGQCIRGQKKQARFLGYQWTQWDSISPCARPVLLGGLPTFVQSCVMCTHPKNSIESLTYHLMWIDTHESGKCFMAYIPLCPSHKRSYHMESWEMTSLHHLSYLVQGYFKSFISKNPNLNNPPKNPNYLPPPIQYQSTQDIVRHVYRPSANHNNYHNSSNQIILSQLRKKDEQVNQDKKYLLEKRNYEEETKNDKIFEEVQMSTRRRETIKRNNIKERFRRMNYNLRRLKQRQNDNDNNDITEQ